MIESPTVFVLGAGANCSYGFPTGEQLKKHVAVTVRKSLNDETRNFLLMQTFGAAPANEVQPARCAAFAEALENAGHASIDAFLNSNSHQLGFQTIGKGAIAQVLLEFEKKQFTRSSDDYWLDYLFKIMLDGTNRPEDFVHSNKVSFITFNYDRLLESWFFCRLKYSFGLDDNTAIRLLRDIPIHHVYGMLGNFPNETNSDQHEWIRASKGIRTIFDTGHDQQMLDSAKSLLESAHIICLLGFGFHRENIELLNLVKHASACTGIVASSRYEILDAEWERLRRPFLGIEIHAVHQTYKCLAALRNLPIF